MNGLFPIKVQVIHNRKQKYYSTGQEVSIRDWEVLPHTKNRHLSEIRRNIENSFFFNQAASRISIFSR